MLSILFVATLVHASLGFGTALVAMPLLVLVLGLYTATPLVALVVLITITVLLFREWRHMDIRSAWQLLVASVFGIPIGLLLLRVAPAYLVKSILGVILIGFSVYNLTRPRLPVISRGPLVYVFGFVAGILGGAYNTNGPPVVLYGALSRWSPEQFRATVQGYFLPSAVMVCVGHAAAGLWSSEVFKLAALAAPVVLIGNLIGVWLARRIPAERFTQILYVVLTALGALMFV